VAYLDAKLHLRSDIRALRRKSRTAAAWSRAAREGRTSPYYFIEAHAAARGDREAIWTRAGGHSWADTLAQSNRYAQWFLARGVGPGDLVALTMINSADFMFAWIGLWAVGAAPAMINYNLAGKALVHCLVVSGAKLILVDGDAEVLRRIAEVREEVEGKGMAVAELPKAREEIYSMPPARPSDELRKDVTARSPMALFYTSGTTGMPKAVPLPVITAFSNGYGISARMDFIDRDTDRWYACMPLYHGTGGISTAGQLLCGVTVCIAPKFSASNFWRDVRDSRATWFSYVGETLRYLLAAPPSPLDKEHNVHSIYGNGLRPDVWKRFKDRFGIDRVFEFFNSSEGVLSLDNPSRNDYTANAVGHHGFLLRWKYHKYLVPVAIDHDTGDIARDPTTGFGTRLPYEEGGEILIAMPFERPFPGYWNDVAATEKKLARDVFRKGDCYYRTGDALRRDGEGRWFFMDRLVCVNGAKPPLTPEGSIADVGMGCRLGDTFRWKGENVSTAEVSEILGTYPGVLDANVYGVQVPGHDGKAGAVAICIDPNFRKTFDHAAFLR